MLSPALADIVIRRLVRLVEINRLEFARSPELCRLYYRNIQQGRHRYVSDRITCGDDDCWSPYRALAERYGQGQILYDCEEAATAHAAWLAARCYTPVYIGLVGGEKVSHAVCGAGEPIKLIDPSRWAGMPPFGRPYEPLWWRKVG